MSSKVFIAALAVTLTMVSGAAAMTGTGPLATDNPAVGAATSDKMDIDAGYTNGTVTVSVVQGGTPVEGAVVEVADGEFTTGENGTVVADAADVEDELDIEVEADGFEGEVTYLVENGDLTIQSEEYEYETGDSDEDASEVDREDNAADDEEVESEDAAEGDETEADDEDEEDDTDESDASEQADA